MRPYIELSHKGNFQVPKSLTKMLVQVTHRHAPRLGDGRRAARHGDVIEMRHTLEISISCKQDFPAPNCAVGSVARAVQGDADHLSIQVVLGHATRDVGVVMLHPNALNAVLTQRPARREVIGMQVVSKELRLNLENSLEAGNGALKEAVALQVLQVADVLAKKSVAAFRQTHGVFELSADRQDRRQVLVQKHRHGHVSARAANKLHRLPMTGLAQNAINPVYDDLRLRRLTGLAQIAIN